MVRNAAWQEQPGPARPLTWNHGRMDVTDFLLLRLAEEQAALDEVGAATATRSTDARADPADAGVGSTAGANRLDRRQAELRALRAVVQLHQGAADIWGFHGCLTCGNVADTTAGFPCPTVRALAAIYADHPDYREEWREGGAGRAR